MKIHLFGGLKEIAMKSELTYECEKPLAVKDLFTKIFSDRQDIIELYQKKIIYAVNQIQVSPDFIVEDKDSVAFMPPFAGG